MFSLCIFNIKKIVNASISVMNIYILPKPIIYAAFACQICILRTHPCMLEWTKPLPPNNAQDGLHLEVSLFVNALYPHLNLFNNTK